MTAAKILASGKILFIIFTAGLLLTSNPEVFSILFQSGEQGLPTCAYASDITLAQATVTGKNYITPPVIEQGSAEQGRKLYIAKCVRCHSIGGGIIVGPDLRNITNLRTPEWLVNFIMHPHEVIGNNDRIAVSLLKQYGVRMPDLGLSRQQVIDILTYLAEPRIVGALAYSPLESPVPPVPKTGVETVEQLSRAARQGLAYFDGNNVFKYRGAPCRACHNIHLLSFPYGGSLGPSLVGIYAKLGPEKLRSDLQNMPYPTMSPIYGGRPLTSEEIGDLIAFFQEAGNRAPPPLTLLLALPMAGGGFIFVLIGVWIVWHRRIKNVRTELVAAASRAERTAEGTPE
jgi:cytochrome c2